MNGSKHFLCASQNIFPRNIRDFIRSRGFNYHHTTTFAEAADFASSKKPHCMVVDQKNFEHLCNGDRSQLPKTGLKILLTPAGQLTQVGGYLKQQLVDDYLLKPVNKGQIACLLGKAEKQRKNEHLVRKISLEEIIEKKLTAVMKQLDLEQTTDLYDLLLPRLERPLIRLVLEHSGGNQLKTSKILGINRNTLRKKLSQLQLSKI